MTGDELADAYVLMGTRPPEVRCTRCGGLGVRFKAQAAPLSDDPGDHCIQCVGTGLTPICSAEVNKGRGTL